MPGEGVGCRLVWNLNLKFQSGNFFRTQPEHRIFREVFDIAFDGLMQCLLPDSIRFRQMRAEHDLLPADKEYV